MTALDAFIDDVAQEVGDKMRRHGISMTTKGERTPPMKTPLTASAPTRAPEPAAETN
jgi:hypothetical protein